MHGEKMKSELTLIGLLVCVLAGCEVIPPEERLVPVAGGNSRPALLVEFTGINCVNCPQAEATATQIEESMEQGAVVVVAMHPASNPFTKAAAPYDYTCEEADVYYRYCGGDAQTPFPAGSINLKAEANGTFFIDYMQWAKTLSMIQALPRLRTTHEQLNDEIAVHIHSLSQAQDTVNLITWLLEDSVQGPQRLEDGSLSTQYYHRHMLRQALSPVWGDTITLEPYEVKKVTYTLPRSKRTHYSVVSALWQHKEIVYAYQTTIQ